MKKLKSYGPSLLVACAVVIHMNTEEVGAQPKERSEIEEQYTWNLAVMYPNQQAWESHYKEIELKVEELAKLQGTVKEEPEALLKVLELRNEVSIQIEKLYAYAMMKHHEDMLAQEPQGVLQRAQTLAVEADESTAWLNPELLELPEVTLLEWLQQDVLEVYGHFFDDLLRSRKHILSTREEEMLAMSTKATSATEEAFSLLTNTELRRRKVKDSEGEEVEVTSPVFYQAMSSKDRRFRRDAFLAYHQGYMDVKGTLAATLAGAAQQDWYYSKARGYESSLQRSLDNENLPVEVYHNLIKTVRAHTGLLQRYVALKQKVLEIDDVHFYDLYVNLVDVPEREYSFEQARDLVLAGVEPLGPEYGAIMKKAFESRWMDVYENQGKISGAYNMGTYLSPPYVLLNFKGTFGDVSTLAHELGHAMQSYFSQQNQPAVYAGYPMFTAEVASTAAEIVFKRFMLDQTEDPKERAYLINQMLEDMRQTVFRQTKFAEFDLAFHQMAEAGEPMTADALMKKGREIHEAYYGPSLAIDPEFEVEPLRIPHYYRNFYVYRYATSFCASAAIAKRVLAGDEQAVEQWMKFLKIGNSQYALDMLKVAGVDMTTPEPIEDAMALFEDLLTQLETLLDAEGK